VSVEIDRVSQPIKFSLDMKPLATIQEVASVLGRSVKTIRRRVDKGQIPAIQEGGKGTELRFDLDDVIEAIKAAAAPEPPPNKSNTSNKRRGPQAKWKQKRNQQERTKHGEKGK
jgi:excisionase family DNA binding protein